VSRAPEVGCSTSLAASAASSLGAEDEVAARGEDLGANASSFLARLPRTLAAVTPFSVSERRVPRTDLHPAEFIRRRLAEWYVDQGLAPPAALEKVAEITLALLRQGPVNVWRHVEDGSLRPRLVGRASDPNEERVATFRPPRRGPARRPHQHARRGRLDRDPF